MCYIDVAVKSAIKFSEAVMKKLLSVLVAVVMLCVSSVSVSASVPAAIGAGAAVIGLKHVKSYLEDNSFAFAAKMFLNAMGEGKEKNYGNVNNVCYLDELPANIQNDIKNSDDFSEAVEGLINRADREGSASVKDRLIEIKAVNDAHMAIHFFTANITVTKLAQGGFNVYVTGYDEYDFQNEQCNGRDPIGTLICGVNNFAYNLQEMKMLKDFKINFGFSYTVDCSHDWNRDQSNGFCTKCGKDYPLQKSLIAGSDLSLKKTLYGNGLTSFSPLFKTSNEAPIRNRPYSPDTILKRLPKGTTVKITGAAYNAVGNLWYQLSDGTWIFSGNVSQNA
jgi:hypothetical protein